MDARISLDQAKIKRLNLFVIILRLKTDWKRLFYLNMNSIYKIGLSKKFLLVAFPFLIGLVIFLTLRSFSHEAEVVKVKVGSIRNSVTGNVQILAEQTFELITEAQGKVVEVALLPFGKPVEFKKVMYCLN